MEKDVMTQEPYELHHLLGKGLMSDVWLAQDRRTQKYVALKIMTTIAEDDLRNQKAQERFLREIAIGSRLRHPHILPLLDHGYMEYMEQHVPYLVIPYMPDGSLANLIKTQPPWKYWPLSQIADIIMQAAQSLWYLHTCTPRIIHHDVKPGNFLIRLEQSPQRIAYLFLCDFGISHTLDSASTMASELLGTFIYIAPEQVERKLNCASDQYGLAVMACQLLTGKLPIQASTNEDYARAHLHDPPIPPGRLNPERITVSEIDRVILRALEKKPEKRFPTILQFADALQYALQLQTQQQASAKTERFTHTLAPTTVPVRREAHHISPPHPGPSLPIPLDAPDLDEERVLDEPLPARPQKTTLRGIAGIYPRLPLTNHLNYSLPARPKMLYWSANGKSIACLFFGNAPRIVSREGKVQEIHVAQGSQATSLCWSPDSRVVAVSTPYEIRFWDTVTQEELPLVLRLPVRIVDALDWSPDGHLALWVENQIVIYTLPSLQLRSPQPPQPQVITTGSMRSGNIGVLHWSPDGTMLAAGASNGAVMCWYMFQRQPAWHVATPGQKVNSISWSPDQNLLAVVFRDSRVVGWNPSTKETTFTWTGLPSMPRAVTISINHRILLASTEKRLLSGLPHEPAPGTTSPGQLLVACSPVTPELVTLDEHQETTFVIWQGC
jgi:serine/threonine protein kinase